MAPLLRLQIQQSTRAAPWALLHPRAATLSLETAPSRSLGTRLSHGESVLRAVRPHVVRDAGWSAARQGLLMTILWFIVWLIANSVGGHEPLVFNPVNAWTATLILAIGLDLAAAHARGTQKGR